MKATSLLKRIDLGIDRKTGKAKKTSRMWRAFFIYLLAGGRPVVMNAKFINGGTIDLTCAKPGGMIVNNTFS